MGKAQHLCTCVVCGTKWLAYSPDATACTHSCRNALRGAYPKRSLLSRLLAKVDKSEVCWVWRGAVGTAGYGRIGVDYRTAQVHRVAYELLVGPIPDGLHIDHLCRNRLCVRPDHLEAVTQAENNRRAGAARRGVAA